MLLRMGFDWSISLSYLFSETIVREQFLQSWIYFESDSMFLSVDNIYSEPTITVRPYISCQPPHTNIVITAFKSFKPGWLDCDTWEGVKLVRIIIHTSELLNNAFVCFLFWNFYVQHEEDPNVNRRLRNFWRWSLYEMEGKLKKQRDITVAA